METTMNKVLTTFIGGAILASTLSADFARIEMGVGAWMQTPSGSLSYTESGLTGSDISNEDQETSGYAWLLIKHPVPILPNLRLEYSSVSSDGLVEGGFKDFTIPTGESATPTLEMTQFDIIPYYNILDNTFWTTIDLGLDIKVIDTSYTAGAIEEPITGTELFEGYSDSATTIIPLLYARGRVEIPATNVGLEADVKYISYADATMYDVRAKVDYTLDFIPVIQPAVEVGYRMIKMETDESGEAKVDLEFSGIYAGVMVRF